MPRVGSKQSIVRTPPATQRAIVTFCWLPPDRRRTSPWARVSICSVVDGVVDLAPLHAPGRSGPSVRSCGRERQRDVLAHRALHQQRLGAVGGRRRRGPPGSRRRDGGRSTGEPSTSSSPPLGRSDPRGCRTARPGPGPRARPRRGPRPDRARTRRPAASRRAARPRAASRGVAPRPRPRRARALGRGGMSLDDLAEHQLDDALLGARGDVDHADGHAFAQDGRAVAHRGDLDHAVGDEDDRALAAALAADDLEDPLGEVRGQRRGHLVEHAARRARWRARGRGR